ncbi:MAG: pyruvate, phosphate dikinase [Anaerolineae bacterium]|nr:pyruvate, phosphate dikinase [Anaerolineae bacterium]
MPVKTKIKSKPVKPIGKPAVKAKKATKAVASKNGKSASAKIPTKGKWVWLSKEGNRDMRELLGGKGAGLAEMTNAGLPVPPSFTITTEACNWYSAHDNQFPKGMWEQVLDAVKKTEKAAGKKFGDPKNPLLVSVRSGAKFSMPGMMDTVLNLGLNDATLQALIDQSGDERFAYDAYRRFMQMFGRIVMGIEAKKWDAIFDGAKHAKGVKADTDLDAEDLKQVVAQYKGLYRNEIGEDFPQDPYKQLELAIKAVFGSWMGRRAVDYRRLNKIPDNLGTAVNVCTMVFGNLGADSGTGVAFTRDPSTGEDVLYGDYLQNAQGEDVVAGIRTPLKISEMKNLQPEAYVEFQRIARDMEKHYREMQDLEFTVERGKLYMLQTRTGKRTARAAVKIAVDMVQQGLITKKEAIQRVEPMHVVQLLSPRFDDKDKKAATERGDYLASGINASPGAATGIAVFDPDTADEWAKEGKAVILVRYETAPDDVHGMYASKGILTQHGGATSHAAVVARGAGLPCVAGCEEIHVDEAAKKFSVGGRDLKEGDFISIDGTTGEVYAGKIQTLEADFSHETDLQILLGWADEVRRLQVWANGDYPRDAVRARAFGAQGIGLCRTEHMFFEQTRLPIVREMILAKNAEARQPFLNQLLPIQRQDFYGILEAMDGLPTVIRLIDPPLHEFLPPFEELLTDVTKLRQEIRYMERESVNSEYQQKELAKKEELLHAVESLREANPMLGLRGCRLGITMPEITRMQVRAIFEAAVQLEREGKNPKPEIMIPLIGNVNELKNQRDILEAEAKQVMAEQGIQVEYKFGTMIEIPRAALTAGEIAEYAEFFSFGTNDLTQTTLGVSRDDAERTFLQKYVDMKILPANPFQELDRPGVGKLMEMATKAGRKTRKNLEVGICGEHGGDPSSIEFCNMIGLNYVSCSPFRVPVARLAAAQAVLGSVTKDK